MLGLPKDDQLLLPFWKVSALLTGAAEANGWIDGHVQLHLEAQGEGVVGAPEEGRLAGRGGNQAPCGLLLLLGWRPRSRERPTSDDAASRDISSPGARSPPCPRDGPLVANSCKVGCGRTKVTSRPPRGSAQEVPVSARLGYARDSADGAARFSRSGLQAGGHRFDPGTLHFTSAMRRSRARIGSSRGWPVAD
jgi:hypothetical protein